MHKRVITKRQQEAKPVAKHKAKSKGDSRGLSPNGRKSTGLTHTAIHVFKDVLPDTAPELIGDFFASIGSLWEVGQELDIRLKQIKSCHDPKQLRDFLIWVSAIQIDMSSYWIGELNKDLPKLLRVLDKIDKSNSSVKNRIRVISR